MKLKFLKKTKINVRHDEENNEFYVPCSKGKVAIQYEDVEDGWKFTAVKIPQEVRTHRVAPGLLEFALEKAKSEKLKIQAGCAYVKNYLLKNPRFQSLLPK